MSRIAWKTLSGDEDGGDGHGLTLAVDFTTSGRGQAQFADLAGILAPHTAATVWASVPPPADADVAHDGEAYLDWWLGEVRDSGRHVEAVLGYCAGAVHAAALAERIAEWQHDAPQLLLFDPELPNTAGLYHDFHAAGDTLAGLLTPEELAEFHAAGQRLEARYGDGELPAAGAELAAVFTAAVGTAAERLELDDDIRDELAGAFDSLVGYLTAATTLDPLPAWSAATALTTSAPAHPVGRELRQDTPHDDLLRDPATARALAGLLDAGRAARTAHAGRQ